MGEMCMWLDYGYLLRSEKDHLILSLWLLGSSRKIGALIVAQYISASGHSMVTSDRDRLDLEEARASFQRLATRLQKL